MMTTLLMVVVFIDEGTKSFQCVFNIVLLVNAITYIVFTLSLPPTISLLLTKTEPLGKQRSGSAKFRI